MPVSDDTETVAPQEKAWEPWPTVSDESVAEASPVEPPGARITSGEEASTESGERKPLTAEEMKARHQEQLRDTVERKKNRRANNRARAAAKAAEIQGNMEAESRMLEAAAERNRRSTIGPFSNPPQMHGSAPPGASGYCGALTQAGTSCRNRVSGGGFCYLHR
jgi:hypothetical protein